MAGVTGLMHPVHVCRLAGAGVARDPDLTRGYLHTALTADEAQLVHVMTSG